VVISNLKNWNILFFLPPKGICERKYTLPKKIYVTENYIDNGGDCNDIFAFLEFVNKEISTIFQKETIIWRNNCRGFGIPKDQTPPVPGKCLLMEDSREIRAFMREFFRKD